jgi:hypothetical protein
MISILPSTDTNIAFSMPVVERPHALTDVA